MALLRAYWRCGPLVIGTAALSFSFTALAIKFLGSSVPPFETVSTSGLLCFIVLTGVIWQHGLPPLPKQNFTNTSSLSLTSSNFIDCDSSPSDRPAPVSRARVTLLTLLRAILGSTATTAFILSLELLSLKDAVTLFFTSPVIALLLDWLLMGRSPGRGGAAATTLTLAGALLVTQPPFLFGDHTKPQPHHGAAAAVAASGDGNVGGGSDGTDGGLSSVGVALALLAAAANASGFLTINLLRGQQHPLVLTWWYNLVLAVVTAAPLALRWPRAPVPPPGRREALLLVAVGTTQLAAQLCLNRGFQLEPPGRGAAINVLQVLFSFILDVAVLGNKPSLLSVGGSSLVAAGVLFVAMSSPSKRASDNKHGHKLGGGEAATVEPVTPSGDREAGAGGQGDGRRVEADAVAVVVTGPRVGDSELRAPLLSADPEPDDA